MSLLGSMGGALGSVAKGIASISEGGSRDAKTGHMVVSLGNRRVSDAMIRRQTHRRHEQLVGQLVEALVQVRDRGLNSISASFT